MHAESKLGTMEILFGLHPVEEALRSGTRKFDHICIARERQDVRLEKLIQACRDAGVKMRLDTRDQLTKLARTEAHQGVVAIVRARQFLDVDDLLQGDQAKPVAAGAGRGGRPAEPGRAAAYRRGRRGGRGGGHGAAVGSS